MSKMGLKEAFERAEKKLKAERAIAEKEDLSALKALVRKEGQAYDLFMALIRSEGASQRLKDWQELRDRLDEAVK